MEELQEQRAADAEDNGVLRPKMKTGRDVRRKSEHSSVADGTVFSWHLARRGSGRMGFRYPGGEETGFRR